MICGPICIVWDKVIALIMSIPFIFLAIVGWNTKFEDWKEKRRVKKEEKNK